MIKEVLKIGNPLLKEESCDFDFNKDDIDEIINNMSDTLQFCRYKYRTGRAIAAPQTGIMKRIVLMDTKYSSITMINPKITSRSSGMIEVWDSCFSADVSFFGKTLRNQLITIEYFDEYGKKITKEFKDDLSELFQHEIDHLNGILFTDRIIDNKIIMRDEFEKLCIRVDAGCSSPLSSG